jgi:hypothetical protein
MVNKVIDIELIKVLILTHKMSHEARSTSADQSFHVSTSDIN